MKPLKKHFPIKLSKNKKLVRRYAKTQINPEFYRTVTFVGGGTVKKPTFSQIKQTFPRIGKAQVADYGHHSDSLTMTIEIEKVGKNHYRADWKERGGTPQVGVGCSKVEALVHLLHIMNHTKETIIKINGRPYRAPDCYKTGK